jgi:hypothetical protein
MEDRLSGVSRDHQESVRVYTLTVWNIAIVSRRDEIGHSFPGSSKQTSSRRGHFAPSISLIDQPTQVNHMDIEARSSHSWINPTSLVYVQVGLTFILIRLTLYTYTAFDPNDRE